MLEALVWMPRKFWMINIRHLGLDNVGNVSLRKNYVILWIG